MNQTTKKWGLLIGTAMLAVSLAACGNGGSGTSSPSPSASAPASPSASAETVKQSTGEFVGLADSHTVEIISEGSPNAYQFGQELLETMNGLKKGDAVSFEFEVKELEGGGTQNVLTKIEKADLSGGNSGPAVSGPAEISSLPATKDFTFNLEGDEEVRTAKLAVGNGFGLYVFDIFTFDSERSLLTMNVDHDYYASIEKLPAGYSLEDIKKTATGELSKVGEVHELAGSEINPLLGGASLLLFSSNDKLTQEVIVKEVDGTGYKIKVNMPAGEPSEGFGPHLFASLSSLVNLK